MTLLSSSEIYKSLENNEDLQGKQVILAHVLLLAQDWATATALLNKGTNSLLTSGWLQSLASGRPVNEKMEPVAWFTYPAIDFLEGIIKRSGTFLNGVLETLRSGGPKESVA